MNKTPRLFLAIPVILALVAMPIYPILADQGSYHPQISVIPLFDPQAVVCRALDMVGMGCASQTSTPPNAYQSKPIRLNFDVLSPVGTYTSLNSSSTSNTISASDLKASISNAKAPHDLTGQKINIVSVPESPEIYELVNGQKHAFPSLAIYYDYGYTLAMIQPITQNQLDKYPRAKLLKVEGSSKIYYLTEGGMVRIAPDPKKILDIYGDRAEDVITISRKEFNFYPANEYVYQISPLNRDVFQVGENGKRYLTPMAVARLGLRADQVAPVSQAELATYKTLLPVID